MRERIPLYVLNKFMRFEKKIYRFNDIKMPQPIHLKSVMYFLATGAIFGIIVALPGLGTIIRLLPSFLVLVIMVLVPFFITHLLVGVGTEKRPPVNALKAFIDFRIMKAKKELYYKGKIIKKQKPVVYINDSTVRIEQIRGKHNESADKFSGETHREKPSI